MGVSHLALTNPPPGGFSYGVGSAQPPAKPSGDDIISFSNYLEDEAMTTTAETCARAVLDVVPLVMRTIRAEMRRHRSAELGVPQFRVLAFLSLNPGASLSAVAEHVGLRLPSMSTLVAGLVKRGLVARRESNVDRRRVTLSLTSRGRATLDKARAATLVLLAERLGALSPQQRDQVVQGLQVLGGAFAAAAPPDTYP
jgi:DNA-binding MarR family transcriptional regulator